MEVKLDISEEQLKELMEKELKDLPKEMIQNILVECIKGYFSSNDNARLENIFVEQRNSWNYVKEPSQFLQKILNDCDYSGLQEVVDKCIEDLKENYRNILLTAISESLINGLTNTYSFQNVIRESIRDELIRLNNPIQ